MSDSDCSVNRLKPHLKALNRALYSTVVVKSPNGEGLASLIEFELRNEQIKTIVIPSSFFSLDSINQIKFSFQHMDLPCLNENNFLYDDIKFEELKQLLPNQFFYTILVFKQQTYAYITSEGAQFIKLGNLNLHDEIILVEFSQELIFRYGKIINVKSNTFSLNLYDQSSNFPAIILNYQGEFLAMKTNQYSRTASSIQFIESNEFILLSKRVFEDFNDQESQENLSGMEDDRSPHSPFSSTPSHNSSISHEADNVASDDFEHHTAYMAQYTNYQHSQNSQSRNSRAYSIPGATPLSITTATLVPLNSDRRSLLKIRLNPFNQTCIDLDFFKICLDQVYLKLQEINERNDYVEWPQLSKNIIKKIDILSNQCKSYKLNKRKSNMANEHIIKFLNFLKKLSADLKLENNLNIDEKIELIEDIQQHVLDFKKSLIDINEEFDDI